jgi:hypothetical protein
MLTRGMAFDEYAAIDAVNFSTLKEMAKSALHYRHRLLTPREDTAGMRMGRAVHTAVLEPDRFPLEHVVFDGPVRRGKEWDAFEAANGDHTILRADEYASCLAIRDAVRSHPVASDLLRGESEVVATWVDVDTHIACKARLDHVNEACIADLKTTSGAVDERTFTNLSARMLYHAQLAFYDAGVPLAHNPRIIAVEAEPPHDVVVYRLSDDAMNAGRQLVSDLLHHLVACRERDLWPGRCSAEMGLTVPPWLLADDSDSTGWGGVA